jgi:protein-tyrosine phosphatase
MSTLQNTREKYLRETCEATDAELAYINSIIQLKRPYFGQHHTISDSHPSEILDSWLFQGKWEQANDSNILQSLSITHIINASERILFDRSRQILHIPSKNGRLAELSKSFAATNAFLDECHQQGYRALVHCERGVSRSSTIILAYLMYHKKWTVAQAFEYLLTKRQQASPNHTLLLQLVRYENELTKANDE